MTLSNLIVAAIWIVFLADAFLNGLNIRRFVVAPPVDFAVCAWVFFFIFAFGATFLQRRVLLDFRPVRFLVDRKFGTGTYAEFIGRLRPATLFMLVCLTLGSVGLVSTYATTQHFGGYFVAGFATSCGVGMLAAYLLSLRFPPRLM